MKLASISARRGLTAAAGVAVVAALSACGGVTTGAGSGGSDDEYPSGTIEMSVGASAGGSSDLISRAMSSGMSEELGVSMPVINKPGANGALAAKELQGATADGYKIAIQNASLFTITPLAVSADEATSIDDFDVVGGVSRDDYMLAANVDSGWENLEDLKAAGQNIRFGTTGVGTGAQLASALTFSSMGIESTPVPFDGGAPALTALLGNQVDVSAMQIGEGIENVEAGKLVALAVFSEEPISFLPDVQTATQQGYDVVVQQYRFMTTPKGTPQAVKDRLLEAMQATFATDAYKKFNEDNNLTPLEVSGEEVVQMLKDDAETNRTKVDDFGINLGSAS